MTGCISGQGETALALASPAAAPGRPPLGIPQERHPRGGHPLGRSAWSRCIAYRPQVLPLKIVRDGSHPEPVHQARALPLPSSRAQPLGLRRPRPAVGPRGGSGRLHGVAAHFTHSPRRPRPRRRVNDPEPRVFAAEPAATGMCRAATTEPNRRGGPAAASRLLGTAIVTGSGWVTPASGAASGWPRAGSAAVAASPAAAHAASCIGAGTASPAWDAALCAGAGTASPAAHAASRIGGRGTSRTGGRAASSDAASPPGRRASEPRPVAAPGSSAP